jgi:glycosyltransferase involved in cell wall biosynthesis
LILAPSNQNKKLKVTFFSVLPPFRGGISSFSQMLLQNLSGIVHVESFTFSKLYPKILFPGKSQEDVSLKGTAPRIVSTFNPFSYLSARRVLKRTSPEVLIVNYWMTIFSPMYVFFSRGFDKNVLKVALIHNLVPHEKRFFDRYFNRIFLNRYVAFVVLSQQVKNEVMTHKPDAVCLHLSHPSYTQFGTSCDKLEARLSLSIPEKAKVILFFGLIRDYKGLDVLIDSMNHLDESYFLVIAGEIYGDDKIYHKLIANCKNANIIINDAYIPDDEVKVYFSAADLCVLPYKKGTQSGVQAIADSFCTPVLVSTNGGLHEKISDGTDGFIIENLERQHLAEKIKDVFVGGKLNIVSEKLKNLLVQKANEWQSFAEELLVFLQKEKDKK